MTPMLATHPGLVPSTIGLRNNGQKFDQPEAFRLIKEGANIPSNTLFDPVITKRFNELPMDVRNELIISWLLTSTLLAKEEKGKDLGEKIIFTDGICTVTIIVNKAFQGKGTAGRGLAADLTKENFNLELSQDGKHVTIEMREEAVKFLKLVSSYTFGQANESTLWIPAKRVLDGGLSVERFFNVSEGPFASLLLRGYDDLDDFRGSVYDYYLLPSVHFGVPEIGTSKANAKTAKPDILI